MQRQRRAAALHCLGEYAAIALIDELARHHTEMAGDIDRQHGACARRLGPDFWRATSGDRLSVQSLWAVGDGQ